MNTEIRQRIAESGKTTIKEMVDYCKMRLPGADIKEIRKEAREIKKEMKAYL